MFKRIIIIFSMLLFLSSCKKENKDIMNEPVVAENFSELVEKINLVCTQIDKTHCTYIKGVITHTLPDYTKNHYLSTLEEIQLSEVIFEKLNNKTPDEMIEEYKIILRKKIKEDIKKDAYLTKSLNKVQESYKNTKHYAKNIIVKDVQMDLGRDNIIKIIFTLQNNTHFNITKFSAETEYYTINNVFITRSAAFSQKIEPWLQAGSSTKITIYINSIPENDIVLVRAATNLVTKVIITSVQTDSKNKNTESLVLSLPHSYYSLKNIINERNSVYKATLKKIDNM